MPSTKPCLSIVAIPIGNPADITFRAVEVLRQADAILCEETKEASSLLKRLGITAKELIPLNEHNEEELVPTLIARMFQNNLQVALISDCGTPVFSDPGSQLIRQAAQFGVQITPIPGPSSLMAALSVLDFKPERFIFAGFLPRDPDVRRRELTRLRGLRMAVVLMDTPYRLVALLDDVSKTFGKGAAVTLVCDISLPKEAIFRGPVGEVKQQVGQRKAEFVLIINSDHGSNQ
jgi:16S rRNA (cytidine1402-2'-O)-methyltransferase